MTFVPGAIDNFLTEVFASDNIRQTCTVLLNNNFEKNTIRSALKHGLTVIITTFSSMHCNNHQLTSEQLFIDSQLYRALVKKAASRMDPILVSVWNWGEMEMKPPTVFDRLVFMNYAPLYCAQKATEEEKQADNLMNPTNRCVWFLKTYVPTILERLKANEKVEWSEGKNLLFSDMCPVAFEKPSDSSDAAYYKTVDKLSSQLGINRNEFFLISIMNLWFAVLQAKLDRKDSKIKILTVGRFSKREPFKFKTNSVLESHLFKVYCCEHPGAYYKHSYMCFSQERIDQENKAFCDFFLDDGNKLDFIKYYREKRYGEKLPEEIHADYIAGCVKGGKKGGRMGCRKAKSKGGKMGCRKAKSKGGKMGCRKAKSEGGKKGGKKGGKMGCRKAKSEGGKKGGKMGGKAVQAVLQSIYRRKWHDKFMQLVDFYKLHGHTRVPVSTKKLGPWVLRQRQQFSRDKLEPERIRILNIIKFEWVVKR